MNRFSRPGILATSLVLFIVASGFAGEEAQEKSKSPKGKKGTGGTVQQIDLSKLPPDLAKQLQKYLASEQKGKEAKTEAKGPKTQGKAYGTKQLPPGLARKPADHPGRIAWLKAHGNPQPETPPKKGKDKKDRE